MSVNLTIKKLRKQKKLTLDELAGLTGLTKGYLSKIERASHAPPFTTLELIAKVFDIDVSLLIDQKAAALVTQDIDVMREEERKITNISESGEDCSFVSLLHSFRGKYMSPILMTFEPGYEKEFEHDSEEFVYLLEGKLELRYQGEVILLKANDCYYLDSRKKHTIKNDGPEQAVMLGVDFNYRRF